MKTPEQIADDQLFAYGGALEISREDVWQIVLAAIEADRAQRAEGTVTIELDPEHYPEETVAEVLDQISRGMASGHYPNWEMHDLERGGG